MLPVQFGGHALSGTIVGADHHGHHTRLKLCYAPFEIRKNVAGSMPTDPGIDYDITNTGYLPSDTLLKYLRIRTMPMSMLGSMGNTIPGKQPNIGILPFQDHFQFFQIRSCFVIRFTPDLTESLHLNGRAHQAKESPHCPT